MNSHWAGSPMRLWGPEHALCSAVVRISREFGSTSARKITSLTYQSPITSTQLHITYLALRR